MFISIVTSLALILQIGAFAVHFHPKHHEHEQLSLDIKQVIATTQTLTGGASAATVNFHVSGMEIA